MRDKKDAAKSSRRKRKVRLLPIILIIIVLVVGILLYDSNTRLVTGEYELSYPNLPGAFDGFRIVVLSDIHAAEFGKNNERLVTSVRDADPDIIAITGDFIHYSRAHPVEAQIEIAETLVEALTPIAPIYFVTGNHEWDRRIGGPWALFAVLEEQGVSILRNRHTRIEVGGESIILAGTEDRNGRADMIEPDEFVVRIREAEGEDFLVVLEHRNFNLKLYSDLGVDLVLCGHSHGGIIRLPFTDGLIGQQRDLFPTYTNGVYSMTETNMVVSRGIGNHTGLLRFLNNPHVVVVELKIEN